MGLFDNIAGLFSGDEESSEETAAADDESPAEPDDGPSGDEPDEVGPEWFAHKAEETVAEWDDLNLDFSVESVERLDDHAGSDDNAVAAMTETLGEDEADEVLARMREGYAIKFGSYFGEVLVRQRDGEWIETEDGWAVSVPLGGDESIDVVALEVAAASIQVEPQFGAVLRKIDAARSGEDGTVTIDRVPAEEPIDDRRQRLIEEAEDLVTTWVEHELDYTPASLTRLDTFVDQQWDDERFRDASLAVDGDPETTDDAVYTGLVMQLGSYYGEVLVRNYDAEWTESDRLGRTVVAVDGGDISIESNVFHVAEDCLTEPSKFAFSHDGVVAELELDAERVASGGTTVRRDASPDEDAPDAATAPEAGVDDIEELAAQFRADAVELAEEWPRYALDFTPNSLVRLDTLAAEEFREFDLEDAELGGEDGDSMFLTAYAMEAAGYVAEVFVRHCDAEWRVEEGPVLVVAGPEAEAQLNPVGIAAAVLRGEDSFTATYEAVRSQLQIDAEQIDDDAGMAKIMRPTERFVLTADSPGSLADAADAFATSWPDYDLDGSPASLARLDDLVAAEGSDTLDVKGVGAYLGEVFTTHYDAAWADEDDAGWVVALEDQTDDTDDPSVLVLPAILRDCLDGDDSFAAFHDAALARTGTDGPTVADD